MSRRSLFPALVCAAAAACSGPSAQPDGLPVTSNAAVQRHPRITLHPATGNGVWLSDSENGRLIYVAYPYEKINRTITAFVNDPQSIAVSTAGALASANGNYGGAVEIYNTATSKHVAELSWSSSQKPTSIAFDKSGNLFVVDGSNASSYDVRKIAPPYSDTGSVIAHACAGYDDICALATDSRGNVVIADQSGNIVDVFLASKAYQKTTIRTSISSPVAVTVDAQNNLYVGNSSNDLIAEYPPSGTAFGQPKYFYQVANGGVDVIAVNPKTKDVLSIETSDNSGDVAFFAKGPQGKRTESLIDFGTGYNRSLAVDSGNNLIVAGNYVANDLAGLVIYATKYPVNGSTPPSSAWRTNPSCQNHSRHVNARARALSLLTQPSGQSDVGSRALARNP
jgi:hypothetical protein